MTDDDTITDLLAGVKAVPPLTPEQERRALTSQLLNKPPLAALTPKHKLLIDYMVNGLPRPHAAYPHLTPNTPLTLIQAADVIGLRRRYARNLSQEKLFLDEMRRQIAALREGEKLRNLQTAIAIRDDIGDDTAATKTVRLKAAALIEGDTGKSNSVAIQINNSNGTAPVQPGYVVVIRKPSDDPHAPASPLIDAAPNP